MNTVTVYASGPFNPDGAAAALNSIGAAMHRLQRDAEKDGREIVWDTLDIDIERNYVTERTFDGEQTTTATWHTVNVNALGLSRE